MSTPLRQTWGMTESPSSEAPDFPDARVAVLRHTLESLPLGDPQVHQAITVFPILGAEDPGPEYLTLDDAVRTRQFRVTEVSAAGSVPELRVFNETDHPVLILDGEELLGAKQNRVVNATFLIPKGFNAVIPVSCTEQGRWRPVSAQFSASDAVLELKARRRKSRSVSRSLAAEASYFSDQGEVWASIAALQTKAQHLSPTSALHDVYQSRKGQLDAALAAFPCVPGQRGILVLLDGRPAGLDVLSRADAYARLHPKLIRSYVLDALLDAARPSEPVKPAAASRFLWDAASGAFRVHPGIGLGESLRRDGDGGGVSGSALVWDGTLIHAAFFGEAAADTGPTEAWGLQSLRNRSGRSRSHGPGHDGGSEP